MRARSPGDAKEPARAVRFSQGQRVFALHFRALIPLFVAAAAAVASSSFFCAKSVRSRARRLPGTRGFGAKFEQFARARAFGNK